mgnify:CR=1 FL=1
MINLKKVGLTALAGSLVAVSAQAGEMSVSGGANLTYVTGKSGDNSAQSLGSDKDVKFSGSGELDNGWTFSVHTTSKDDLTVSSTATTITMGSMGTIGMGSGGGTNINGAYDEPTPMAYEEISDGGQGQSAANYVGNFADDNALVYSLPAMEMMGATINMGVEYSLQADGSATAADGGTIARSNTYGNGYGVGVTVGYDALTIGAYVAERENKNQDNTADVSDEFNGTWFATYNFGPVSIGYSKAVVESGLTSSSAEHTTTNPKTVGTSGGSIESESMSIAFNVNDNLSISYGETTETYDSQDHNSSGTATEDVDQDIESLQVAYSMGSMSIKAYTTETTNPNYDADANKQVSNEIALGLAF